MDKERFLLYFDWAEGKTLSRSMMTSSLAFVDEGMMTRSHLLVGGICFYCTCCSVNLIFRLLSKAMYVFVPVLFLLLYGIIGVVG